VVKEKWKGKWSHIFICHYFLGYTAVPGAVKRDLEYLRSSGQLQRVVHKIIVDI
jgi:hypothetical protein